MIRAKLLDANGGDYAVERKCNIGGAAAVLRCIHNSACQKIFPRVFPRAYLRAMATLLESANMRCRVSIAYHQNWFVHDLKENSTRVQVC
jgi:hypothetical protein